MRPFLSLLIVSLFVLTQTSCAWVVAGTGARLGAAAQQEGGVSRVLSDVQIQALINDLWFQYDVATFAKLDLTVNSGRVLVTGVVQNPDHRVEAIRLAWQVDGVEQVINEIKIADSEGLKGYAKDTWITSRLRAAILFDKQVQSLNYSIDTVQGAVYLMGVADSQVELDHVIETARGIPNVTQVVSYVKVPGPLVDGSAP